MTVTKAEKIHPDILATNHRAISGHNCMINPTLESSPCLNSRCDLLFQHSHHSVIVTQWYMFLLLLLCIYYVSLSPPSTMTIIAIVTFTVPPIIIIT